MPGPVNSKPNDQSVDVAIIEFTDDGSFTNEDQLNKALGCITTARRTILTERSWSCSSTAGITMRIGMIQFHRVS